jgi:hypothetical protein
MINWDSVKGYVSWDTSISLISGNELCWELVTPVRGLNVTINTSLRRKMKGEVLAMAEEGTDEASPY